MVAKQQFNVYLPPELVRQVKHQAIDEGMGMSDWVEHVFRHYLAAQQSSVSADNGDPHRERPIVDTPDLPAT